MLKCVIITAIFSISSKSSNVDKSHSTTIQEESFVVAEDLSVEKPSHSIQSAESTIETSPETKMSSRTRTLSEEMPSKHSAEKQSPEESNGSVSEEVSLVGDKELTEALFGKDTGDAGDIKKHSEGKMTFCAVIKEYGLH